MSQATKAATAQKAVDDAAATKRLLESERDSLKVRCLYKAIPVQ